MTKFNDFAARLAAAFCTVVVSATLVAGAVGPAAIPAQASPVVSVAA